MGLSLHPARLKRYKDVARLLFKYGRSDLVARAGLDDAFPGRVNRLLDAVAHNELKLKIEVIDEGAVIHELQKVANRITLGLLLASLIIGAAMLMRVDTPFRLFGYPGFAMLFFLVAAGGGIWLAFTILSSDRPHRTR